MIKNNITLLIIVIASFAVVCCITIVKFSPKYQEAKIMVKNSENVDESQLKQKEKNALKLSLYKNKKQI